LKQTYSYVTEELIGPNEIFERRSMATQQMRQTTPTLPDSEQRVERQRFIKADNGNHWLQSERLQWKQDIRVGIQRQRVDLLDELPMK
jgi:hypothetical protein